MSVKPEEDNSKRRRYANKIIESSPPINSLIDLVQVGHSIKFYRNIDCVMLWRITPYLEQLDQLAGMGELKETLFLQLVYYLQGMHKRGDGEEYLHTVLYGPPGCGKTTVAKIIGNIYKSMGILSDTGVFRTAHREDFIAGYLGQTATKTLKLLKSCVGGVLFIDEAYALAPDKDDRDSFAKEAVDTLNAFLSEHVNDFCCIIAGYEDAIENSLFSLNEGLRSRFPWVHRISPYDAKELTTILLQKVESADWQTDVGHAQLERLFSSNMSLFVHTGRDIQTYLTKCKLNHARRLLNESSVKRFVLGFVDFEAGIVMCQKKTPQKQSDVPPGIYI